MKKMKKILSLLIILVMTFVFMCACGTNNVRESSENTESEEVAKEEEVDESTISGAPEESIRSFIIKKDTMESSDSAYGIKRMHDSDDAIEQETYKKWILGGTITMDGTVVRVEERIERFGSTDKAVYIVSLRGGWKITLLQEFHPEAASLKKGDEVDVVSDIKGAYNDWIDLYNIGTIAGDWYDRTQITRR